MSLADESRDVIRLALFIPGGRQLARAIEGGEWIENPRDGSFGKSFSFGNIDVSVRNQIDHAPGALLLKLQYDLERDRKQVVATVEALYKQGAIAVRLEQSKLGWAVGQWLDLVRSGDPWDLHRCTVTMLVNKERVVSCGMHAFSLPDASVSLASLTPEDAQHLISILNVYQIGEAPLLLSGQTFSPDADSPRRVLQRWPDDGYPPDHWCHNPYGVWRLSEPGEQPRKQPKLKPFFMPALVVVLQALENKSGHLSRQQVEETTRQGTCIAMEHEHALEMERSRGYADIDPELAWEQWCVVRVNRESDAS